MTGEAAQAPQSTPVQMLLVTEDEDGMRLDRWFRRVARHGPLASQQDLPQGRGARRRQARRGVDRLKVGNVVRVPPLKIDVEAPAVKRAPAHRRRMRSSSATSRCLKTAS